MLRNTKNVTVSASQALKQYSAAAAAQAAAPQAALEPTVRVSTLSNGLKVGTIDAGGAITSLALCLKGGSRAESLGKLGITHLLRNAAFLTNAGKSTVNMVREMQNTGGSFESQHSREALLRTCTFMRGSMQDALDIVAPDITGPKFRSFELNQAVAQCRLDNATNLNDESINNLDSLHKVVFRTGLGNSLFASNLTVGDYTSADLLAFSAEAFVGNKVGLFAVNADHDETVQLASHYFSGLPNGEAAAHEASVFKSGEVQVQTSLGNAYITLVGPGCGQSSADLPAYSVLQHLIGGTGTNIKGQTHFTSLLGPAIKAAAKNPVMVTPVNLCYSDAGMFGMSAIVHPADSVSVMQAAADVMTGIAEGGVSDEALEIAKVQATSSMCMSAENSADLLEDLANQVLLTGDYTTTLGAGVSRVMDVTKEDLVRVANQVLASPALCSTGNIAGSPYLDQLV